MEDDFEGSFGNAEGPEQNCFLVRGVLHQHSQESGGVPN
jgi:hypothetical protein